MKIGWVASLLMLLCAAGARGESMNELYAKAKAEGTLALWGAGPTAIYETAAREFEQRFPGIKVVITGGFSNVLNTKIEEQVKAKRVEADLLVLQTVQDFVRWNRRGLMLHFKPEGFEKFDRAYKDKDGGWIGVFVIPLFYGYNTDQVKPADVPKSALDFLKPQFRGRLITSYPSDDDATLYDFYLIVRKYGWSYMDKYMAQQPKFIEGHIGVARSVASGESLVTLDNSLSSNDGVRRQGGKIALAAPVRDRMPVFFVGEGILKDAPHPNAAKLYATWFLSQEQQSRTGLYSARSDVPPPDGLRPLASYKPANGFREFVGDEKQVAALRKRFERYTGPVTNMGGVR